MSEPFINAIAELAERGSPRGADRVFNDALQAPAQRDRHLLPLAITASFVAVVVLATALAIRSRSHELKPVAPVVPTDPIHALLAGSAFAVESITVGGQSSPPDQAITAEFDTDFVRYHVGCGGIREQGYYVDGDRLTNGPDPWFAGSGSYSVHTDCTSDALVIVASTVSDGRVESQGDQITLSRQSDGASVTLQRIAPAPKPPLLETRWWLWQANQLTTTTASGCGRAKDAPCTALTVQNGDPDMTDDQPSIVIGAAGATLLNVPCASGPIDASWSGERLTLGPATTQPDCQDPNGGVQHWLRRALPGEFTVRYDGQHLTLLADDGTTLFFHANAG